MDAASTASAPCRLMSSGGAAGPSYRLEAINEMRGSGRAARSNHGHIDRARHSLETIRRRAACNQKRTCSSSQSYPALVPSRSKLVSRTAENIRHCLRVSNRTLSCAACHALLGPRHYVDPLHVTLSVPCGASCTNGLLLAGLDDHLPRGLAGAHGINGQHSALRAKAVRDVRNELRVLHRRRVDRDLVCAC